MLRAGKSPYNMLPRSLPDKNKKTLVLLFALIVLSFSGVNPGQVLISAQTDDSTCTVEILGGSPNMYPGEHVDLAADLEGVAQNYSWTVEGPIIKDYDANVYNSTYLGAYLNIDPPTYMSPEDFNQAGISFYWQPNATDKSRTVSLKVQTADNGACEVSKEFAVSKNNDNINLQAEDFFVERNYPVGLTADARNNTQILQQHRQWHNDNFQLNQSYSNKGALFFNFHKIYLAHFDVWRDLFGYPRIVAWDPGTAYPEGVEINHTNRLFNHTTYQPLALPSWFNYHTGSEDPENRSIWFARSYEGQDKLPLGHPLANSGLTIEFRDDSPFSGRLAYLNGHAIPMCEEMNYPKNTSGYPLAQDSLDDFEPDQILLGCALTVPYHDSRHGGVGRDMQSTAHAPRDPIFWRLHKFLDSVSEHRFFPPLPLDAMTSLTRDVAADTFSPQIIAQNPFILYPYLTSLPTISEKEKGLFGITGVQALSAQFNEPVTGVKASDFTVNGSPATQVSGTGVGPYVFIGFKSVEIGPHNSTAPVNVTFSSGNITDAAGNRFQGSSWNYTLVWQDIDRDRDGLKDGLEVNLMRTNPTIPDSDKDTIPDGIEATTTCLNPLVDDSDVMGMLMQDINTTVTEPMGMLMQDLNTTLTEPMAMAMQDRNTIKVDSDRDNQTNVEEFQNKTDPCSADSTFLKTGDRNNVTNTLLQNKLSSNDFLANSMSSNVDVSSIVDSNNNNTNMSMPFALIIKKTGGIAGTSSQLLYDSFSKKSVSIANGNQSMKQISTADEMVAKRVLNDSGFFDSNSFYPPPPNSADYFEYTMFGTLNGKLHAVYWTDASQGVPYGISNLPYILDHILGSGGLF